MPYVMNTLNTSVSTQAQGKYFTIKPGEIKFFHQPEIARFLGQMRGEEGLVEVPDYVMEKDKDDPERVQFLEERRREGIEKRVRKLEWIKHNLLSSLSADLQRANFKHDPLLEASKGELAAVKELNSLKGEVQRRQISIAEEMKKALGESTELPVEVKVTPVPVKK